MSEKNTFSAQDERLNILHKRILDIKKKIQLSEGQRKSWFEECNSRNKENIQKILLLKKEIKSLHAEPLNINVIGNSECNTYFNNMNPTDLRKVITNYEKEKYDESIIRLRKKIDYMICNKEKKKRILYNMLNSYKKVITNNKVKHSWKELEFAFQQKNINLENKLQRLTIMQMEADTINKKYNCVRTSLNLDAACYNSSLSKLEENSTEMVNEVARLEEAKAGALHLRDFTKNVLNTQESSTMTITKEWDEIIMSYRKKVEDRKVELDRLERAIYPAVHLPSADNCDTNKLYSKETYDEKGSEPLAIKLKKAILNLQNAAEVTKKNDVLNQFLKQRNLKQKLQTIRFETEQEKISLENKRQVLSTEVEVKKFVEAEDTDQGNEELLNIVHFTANERIRQKRIMQKNKNIQDLTKRIFGRFQKLYATIPNVIMLENVKQSTSLTESLKMLKNIIKEINMVTADLGYFLKKATFSDKKFAIQTCHKARGLNFSKNLQQEDVLIEWENSSIKDKQEEKLLFPLFYNTTALSVPQMQLSEDEDEIASRNLLKKQAQFLVDTKSRRKGFTFKRSAIM